MISDKFNNNESWMDTYEIEEIGFIHPKKGFISLKKFPAGTKVSDVYENNNPYYQSTKRINLFSFLDYIGCNLVLRRYSNQDDRWIAKIEDCVVKKGEALVGYYGTGKYPDQAINDYVQNIKGKLIIINAVSPNRKEFKVPELLYFK